MLDSFHFLFYKLLYTLKIEGLSFSSIGEWSNLSLLSLLLNITWILEAKEVQKAHSLVDFGHNFSFVTLNFGIFTILHVGFQVQDPDLVVESMSTGSSSQSARPASSSTETPPSNDQPRSRSTGRNFVYASYWTWNPQKKCNASLNYQTALSHYYCILNQSVGSTARTSGTSANAGSGATSLRWDRQTIQFSVNAWVCT